MKMKPYLPFLMMICLLTACTQDQSADEPEREDLAVWCYMVADNNLENDLMDNVVQMYRGLSTLRQEATLLVYWDGKSQYLPLPTILRYHVDKKGKINGHRPIEIPASLDDYGKELCSSVLAEGEMVRQYGQQWFSTEKETMTRVLTDMREYADARRIGLIASSHGSGWLKHIDGRNARSFGQDGKQDASSTILTSDMAEAIRQAGIQPDFLLFDACMMGCAEVVYDFADVCHYMLVSSIIVPSPGFPYDEMMGHLLSGTLDGYQRACETYIAHYDAVTDPSIKFGNIAIVDCTEAPALAVAFKAQLEAHAAAFPFTPSGDLQYYGERGTNFRYFSADMQQFIEELNGGIAPQDFLSQLSRTVIYKDYVKVSPSSLDFDGNHYCGLGVYVPVEKMTWWNEYFQTLKWYSAAGWDTVPWQYSSET